MVLGERQQPQGIGRRASGAIFHCAFYGNKSQTKEMSCVVTMQYDHYVGSCVAFVAEAPSFGPRRTFLEAMVMANNAQRPCGRTKAQVAVQWTSSQTFGEEWCNDVETGTAVQWRTVEEQIEVGGAALTLVDGDRGSQRAASRVSRFAEKVGR